MKAKKIQKLKELQEEERKKQLESGDIQPVKEITIIEEENQSEDSEGIKDLEEIRQMKFRENDPNVTVEMKKSVAEFGPNYGVRLGEVKKKNKALKSSATNSALVTESQFQDNENSILKLKAYDGSKDNLQTSRSNFNKYTRE